MHIFVATRLTISLISITCMGKLGLVNKQSPFPFVLLFVLFWCVIGTTELIKFTIVRHHVVCKRGMDLEVHGSLD